MILWSRRNLQEEKRAEEDNLSASWLDRLNSIGEEEAPNDCSEPVFLDEYPRVEPNRGIINTPNLTKEQFLARPPPGFDYPMSVGHMRLTLITEDENCIQYHSQLIRDGYPDAQFGFTVFIFKQMCDRLMSMMRAYNLDKQEQIINEFVGFADPAVRQLKCDWSIWAFSQFGFIPYEDTV